jgi:hypothetical protein
LGRRCPEEAKRMTMTKFEQFFINRKGRSQHVVDYAEKMLRLAGLRPARAIWTLDKITVEMVETF